MAEEKQEEVSSKKIILIILGILIILNFVIVYLLIPGTYEFPYSNEVKKIDVHVGFSNEYGGDKYTTDIASDYILNPLRDNKSIKGKKWDSWGTLKIHTKTQGIIQVQLFVPVGEYFVFKVDDKYYLCKGIEEFGKRIADEYYRVTIHKEIFANFSNKEKEIFEIRVFNSQYYPVKQKEGNKYVIFMVIYKEKVEAIKKWVNDNTVEAEELRHKSEAPVMEFLLMKGGASFKNYQIYISNDKEHTTIFNAEWEDLLKTLDLEDDYYLDEYPYDWEKAETLPRVFVKKGIK